MQMSWQVFAPRAGMSKVQPIPFTALALAVLVT